MATVLPIKPTTEESNMETIDTLTHEELRSLNSIISGRFWNTKTVNRALECADNLEVEVVLRAMLQGHMTDEIRWTIQDFICRLWK